MGDIKAGVTLMQDFCRAGSEVYQSYVDYLDREEAQRNDAIQTYNLYHDYMGNPEKSTGLFTEEKYSLSFQEKKELKNIFQTAQENGSLMWQTVLSFDNRWLEQNNLYDSKQGLLDEARLKQVASMGIRRMLQKEGLELAVWTAAIHYNTDNIHIHVATVEPHPMREVIKYQGREEYKGKFKMKNLEMCKSSVVNEIMHTKEINYKINNIIRSGIAKSKRERRLAEDPEIREKFLELYQNLPDVPWNMRHYGNSIMHPCRPLIDDISRLYIDKYHKEEYRELKSITHHQSELYDQAYGMTDRSFENQKEEELMKNLGNAILDEVKEYEKKMNEKINKKQTAGLPEIYYSGRIDETETGFSKIDAKEATMEDKEYSLKLSRVQELEITPEVAAELDQMEAYWEYQDRSRVQGKSWGKEAESENGEASEKYKRWYGEFKDVRKALIPDENKIDREAVRNVLETGEREGNPFILYLMGELYGKGRSYEIDMERSEQCFSKAFTAFIRDEADLDKTPRDEGRFSFAAYVQYRIGKQLDRGMGVAQDHREAAMWYEKSGAGYAMYSLGNLYFSGEGVEQDYSKALRLYESVSDNAFANLKCAQMYKKGLGCKIAPEKAEEYCRRAYRQFEIAESKQPDDMMEYQLGRMLYRGEGCQHDLTRSIEYLELAAEKSNENAEYLVSTIYIEQGIADKIPEAIERLEQLADRGKNSNAQYALGELFMSEESGHYDLDKGIDYLKAAAEQGHDYGQYQLGKLYTDPSIEIYDLEKGLEYLKQSSSQENEYAQYWLGKIYTDPASSVHDLKEGIKYLNLSAEQGNGHAQYRLGTLYTDPLMGKYDLVKGIEFLEEAADQGHVFAQYRLGKLYTNPDMEIYALEKGVGYLEKAAGQKNEYAQYLLGKLYMDQDLKIYDPEKGIIYLELAKKAGNVPAQYLLGCRYLDRDCPAYDREKGLAYINDLAEKGNSYAQTKLGCEYLKGENVQRDLGKAREWLSQAAGQGNELASSILTDIDARGIRCRGQGRNELDKALYMLQRSMDEEHRRNMQIMRQYDMEQQQEAVNEL